jgi:hypothetical protein
MTTAFDRAIEAIKIHGYHNHRLETHSNTVGDALLKDMLSECSTLRQDFESGVVRAWKNVASPGDRSRKVDLFIGEPDPQGKPDISRVRIAVENKSVITAHRNRTNRFDDLSKVLSAIHSVRPEALLIATVLIGLAQRVLNVPDKVHGFFRDREDEFQSTVKPRFSSGDHTLWNEFSWGVSTNRPNDPQITCDLLKTIPTREPGHTHVKGYDSVVLVPVMIDNVNPPSIPRPNALGIDVDAEYARLLARTCAAYSARWHLS